MMIYASVIKYQIPSNNNKQTLKTGISLAIFFLSMLLNINTGLATPKPALQKTIQT